MAPQPGSRSRAPVASLPWTCGVAPSHLRVGVCSEPEVIDLPRDLTSEISAGSHSGARSVDAAYRARPRSGGSMSLPYYASRGPVRFLLHYVCRRSASHLVVLLAVLGAVGCAIGAQYAVKNLVDVLGFGKPSDWQLWSAVALLLALVAGDNLLWRLAGWVATHAFV